MICKIWYIDDGCLGRPGDITLSTECFDVDSIDLLIAQFKKVGINANKRRKSSYSDHVVRIGIYGTEVNNFLNYIGKCPVKLYEYKWDLQGWKIQEHVCSYCQKPFSYYSAKRYRKTCGEKECYLKRSSELRKLYYRSNKDKILKGNRQNRILKKENCCVKNVTRI